MEIHRESSRSRGRARQHARRVRYPDTCEHSFLSFTFGGAKIAPHTMKEAGHENQHAPPIRVIRGQKHHGI